MSPLNLGTHEVHDEDDHLSTGIHGCCHEVAAAKRLSEPWRSFETKDSLILDEPPRVASTQPPLGEESNDLGRTRDSVSDVPRHEHKGKLT